MSGAVAEMPMVKGCWPAHLDAFEKSPGWSAVPWAVGLRKRGSAAFHERGFPTTDDEDWRYTSVQALAATAFRQSLAARADALVSSTAKMFGFGLEGGPRIVLVDGFFSPELSDLTALPKGVRAGGLLRAMTAEKARVETHLGEIAPPSFSAFAALNAALFQDGAFLDVPAGVKVETPILILHLSHESYLASHPRNLYRVGAGASVQVLEAYASPSCDLYFTNAVTEVDVERGGRLIHGRIESESGNAFHVACTQGRVAEDGLWQSDVAALGAGFFRHDLGARLVGERAEARMFGLTIASGKQHVDHHTAIDHAVPHCPSREYYKAILNGRSRVVFNGKVYVREDAQKTDAKQTNRSLLLSEDARVDTKPQLEIFADDVKCTHGATVGQLDEDMIHYCRTRGMSPAVARGILTYAFARDVLQNFGIPAVKEHLDRSLVQRLLDAGRGA
ncbi:MAG: Fe-S cluster assembly protein SufD [Candidatus Brocadiae bacterium]|nr:Fe-S cluster assembly protein SufD [Candidatus Brocadiia bacterium]